MRYLATEPSEPFLATLMNKVPSFVECGACAADAIPLPNNSVKVYFSTRVPSLASYKVILHNLKTNNKETLQEP